MKIDQVENILQNDLIKLSEENLSTENSFELFKQKFILYISELIDHDFEKLIFILYKVDVDENKLKSLLASNADAASVIADLIIERQVQKISSRESFKMKDEFDEEEKW